MFQSASVPVLVGGFTEVTVLELEVLELEVLEAEILE